MNTNPTQAQRLLEALRVGPVDPLQAWSDLGIYRLSARKYDLEKMGHVINKRRKTVKNKFGEPCCVAEYQLVQEACA